MSARTWTNQDNPGIPVRRESIIVQEIRVMRDDDSIVPPSFREHILIATPSEANITDVSNVEALASKNLRDLLTHAFINKETDSSPILGVHSPHFVLSW